MFPVVALSLAAVPGADPVGPKKYPPVYIPVETPAGYLYQPTYDLQLVAREPIRVYEPKPGDILLMSNTTPFWTTLYRLALTGRPGHSGIVVTMPDGKLGVLEAGFNDTTRTRITPLEYRLAQYPGSIWIRQRIVPLTPEQDASLTAFAVLAAQNTRYAVGRFALQITPFSGRGPLRLPSPANRVNRVTACSARKPFLKARPTPDCSTHVPRDPVRPTRKISFMIVRGTLISTSIRHYCAGGCRQHSGRRSQDGR